MQEELTMIYYWLKAGHIIFVIFWMAGLFMLPRLFVYHQECPPDSPENALWVVREQRLIRIILNPSMIVVWVLGILLALNTGAFSHGMARHQAGLRPPAQRLSRLAGQLWQAAGPRRTASGRQGITPCSTKYQA